MDPKRAARIEQLLHVPAFEELGEELREAEARYWARHVLEVQAGTPLDQRELDFMRGKFEAIKQILKQPTRAHLIAERDRAKTEEEPTNEV